MLPQQENPTWIVLRESSQTQKTIYYMVPIIWCSGKSKNWGSEIRSMDAGFGVGDEEMLAHGKILSPNGAGGL